jgi:hypothetical protein
MVVKVEIIAGSRRVVIDDTIRGELVTGPASTWHDVGMLKLSPFRSFPSDF